MIAIAASRTECLFAAGKAGGARGEGRAHSGGLALRRARCRSGLSDHVHAVHCNLIGGDYVLGAALVRVNAHIYLDFLIKMTEHRGSMKAIVRSQINTTPVAEQLLVVKTDDSACKIYRYRAQQSKPILELLLKTCFSIISIPSIFFNSSRTF